MSKRQTRSEAREEAFKLIFQRNMHQGEIEALYEHLIEETPECLPNMRYIKGVVNGVIEKEEEISRIIRENLSKGWKAERLPKATLCILELAVYEMKYAEDVPVKVAVNEAVELVKKYDDPEKAAFVNGVLGGVFKSMENKSELKD